MTLLRHLPKSCWLIFPVSLASAFHLLELNFIIGLLLGLLLAAIQLTPLGQRSFGAMKSLQLQSLLVQVVVSVALIQQIIESVSGAAGLNFPMIGLLSALSLALYALYIQNQDRAQTVYRNIQSLLGMPPLTISLLMAISITAFLLALMHWSVELWPQLGWLESKFLERGIIPPLTLVLFLFGVLLLLNKSYLIISEMRQFRNEEKMVHSAILSCFTGVDRDEDAQYLLDVMWKTSVESYSVVRYLCWAIPILGFIGTVLGISLAASGIQNLIGSAGGLSQFNSELGAAIAPLGIAFDTTLIALSLSLPLVWLMTILQNKEGDLLNLIEQWLKNLQNV